MWRIRTLCELITVFVKCFYNLHITATTLILIVFLCARFLFLTTCEFFVK